MFMLLFHLTKFSPVKIWEARSAKIGFDIFAEMTNLIQSTFCINIITKFKAFKYDAWMHMLNTQNMFILMPKEF